VRSSSVTPSAAGATAASGMVDRPGREWPAGPAGGAGRAARFGPGRPSVAYFGHTQLCARLRAKRNTFWAPSSSRFRRPRARDSVGPCDVDGGIGFDPAGVIEAARLAEQVGYDGLWSAEVNHDPFFPLALAAEHTERIKLGTGIAVAFARNPMTLAQVANDLQTLSRGRFLLGLGSQIKPHIEKRFSMPWSHPAPADARADSGHRAIWASWSDGSRLAFRGEFYRHTLMTPMFDPGPNPFGNPRIFWPAVGEKMTEVAGEVADGMLAHGFTPSATCGR
jgi:hypothetical protein